MEDKLLILQIMHRDWKFINEGFKDEGFLAAAAFCHYWVIKDQRHDSRLQSRPIS